MSHEINNIKLSFIITTFGLSKGLTDIIKNFNKLKSEVREAIEVIVINDNISEFINLNLKNIIVVNNKINLGEAACWEFGVKLSKGMYVTILADDDMPNFGKIPNIINTLGTNLDTLVYFGNYKINSLSQNAYKTNSLLRFDILLSFFFNKGFVSIYSLIKKEYAQKLLSMRSLHDAKVGLLNEYLLLYEFSQLKLKNMDTIDYTININDNQSSYSANNIDIEIVEHCSINIIKNLFYIKRKKNLYEYCVASIFIFRVYREIIATQKRKFKTLKHFKLKKVNFKKNSMAHLTGYFFANIYLRIRN